MLDCLVDLTANACRVSKLALRRGLEPKERRGVGRDADLPERGRRHDLYKFTAVQPTHMIYVRPHVHITISSERGKLCSRPSLRAWHVLRLLFVHAIQSIGLLRRLAGFPCMNISHPAHHPYLVVFISNRPPTLAMRSGHVGIIRLTSSCEIREMFIRGA